MTATRRERIVDIVRHIDVAQLRRQLSDPWATEPARLASADDISALARTAYVEGDVAARRVAEEILYFLNIDSCFAPPLQPELALVWTTLMRTKLQELRRRYGGCEPIGTVCRAAKNWAM